MIENVIDKLQNALEANRRLRDDNHVCTDAVLLYTEATDTVKTVALMDLPLRLPLTGKGCRWSYQDQDSQGNYSPRQLSRS